MNVKIYLKSGEVSRDIILPNQCHSQNIVSIVSGAENLNNCDGLVTSNKDFLLGVQTADCAPICFSDGEKIGIAHIGWRGLCLPLIEKMLENFDLNNLEVFIGPFNHSFEIQKDFCYEKINDKFGNKYFREENSKITFLFRDAIMSLLPENTKVDPRNTFEDQSLLSFRRDKTKERLVTVVSF